MQFGTFPFMALYVLGGMGPTAAPFIVISLLDRDNMKEYLSRLLKWRIHPIWYLLSIMIVILVSAMLMLIEARAKHAYQPWYMLFPLFLTMIIGGGLEELGWRGFLLDNLLNMKWGLLISGLVIGAIWALWHLPLFYIRGVGQYGSSYALFFIAVIGLSFILTTLYSSTKSVLLCIIFHAMRNTAWAMGFTVEKNDNHGKIIENLLWLVVGTIFISVYALYSSNSKRTAAQQKLYCHKVTPAEKVK